MKVYRYGKDEELMPCIELKTGSVHTDVECLLALAKALVKKGVLTKQDILDEL